jgi:hypothetical protein
MSTDDALREILAQTAKDLRNLSDNPSTWGTWLVYLLDQLEQQAMNETPMDADLYREMLPTLQDAIRSRLNTGGWW